MEGIRAIAAVLVLVRHVGQHTTDPDTTGILGLASEAAGYGLTLFFALSGFLLYRPFAAAIIDERRLPSIRRYALNRVLRIMPAYLVIFLVTCLILGYAYTEGAPGVYGYDSVGRLTEPVGIALNLLLLQTYVPGWVLTGIGASWSLSTEFAFYIALPLLAIGAGAVARRWQGSRAVFLPPFVLIGVGITTTWLVQASVASLSDEARLEALWGQTGLAVVDRSLLAQADLFGYGMLAAIGVAFAATHRANPRTLAIAAIIVGSIAALAAGTRLAGPLSPNAVGVLASSFVLVVALTYASGSNPVARALDWRPVRLLGEISYSFYLWHLPVILALRVNNWTIGEGVAGLLLTTIIATAITACLSVITYVLVERPAMRLRARRARPPAERPSST